MSALEKTLDTQQAISPIQPSQPSMLGIWDPLLFTETQRVCKLLASSSFAPDAFRDNVANCMIALDVASRLRASPMMVMQNMYIVYGRPSWSSTFIAGMINSCDRFEPLRFEMAGEGDDRTCTAWTYLKGTRDRIQGTPASVAMAKAEGWWDKKDRKGNRASKWPTMTEQMLTYRAISFFGRVHAPELLIGMPTKEEAIDIGPSIESEVSLPSLPEKTATDIAKATGEDLESLKEQAASTLEQIPTPKKAKPVTRQSPKPKAKPSPKPQPTSRVDLNDTFERFLFDSGITPEQFKEWCFNNYDENVAEEYGSVGVSALDTQWMKAILKERSAFLKGFERR